MATDRLPGGYIDRQALVDARHHNRTSRRAVHDILAERPSVDRLYQLLAVIASELASQDDDLEIMDAIRTQRYTGEDRE
jgi:hypothetical protein